MADLRELLILGLALLILFSLMRAVYVIHRRRKGQLRLSIDKTFGKGADAEDSELSELPNGGARSVPAEEGEDAESVAAAEDGELDGPIADENVPVLLDPVTVAPAGEAVPEVREQLQKTQRKRKKRWKDEIFESNGDAARNRDHSDFDIELGAVSMTAGERIGGESPKRSEPQPKPRADSPRAVEPEQSIETPQTVATAEVEEPVTVDRSPDSPDPVKLEQTLEMDHAQPAAESTQPEQEAASGTEPETEAEDESAEISPDKIIAINVVATEGNEFAGRELWDFLIAAGLQHDKMKILSKFEGNRADGRPIFRVANIVNPGVFDADAIDEFSTPGISMFMLLPAPINNLLAFEQMLAVARRLAEALDGRLLDIDRKEMTSQGIEQARRRIREFDMKTSTSSSVCSQI